MSTEAGNWCADNANFCPRIWWCGFHQYLALSVVGVAIWLVLFWTIMIVVYPLVAKQLAKIPSTKKDEGTSVWFAVHVQSTIHAIVIIAMTLVPTTTINFDGDKARYSTPEPPNHWQGAMVGNGAHIFFCYTVADTILTFWRKEMTIDYLLHHSLFILVCLIIQHDCNSVWPAGRLLQMEASTIFLNFYLFFRNRLGNSHPLVATCFLLFAAAFIVFRLVSGFFTTTDYLWVVYMGKADLLGAVPRWHLHVLSFIQVIALVLQIFWGVRIARIVVKSLTSRDGMPDYISSGGPTGGKSDKSD